jgi:class 3 adenylate cyclase
MYLDRHDMPGLSPEALAEAHTQDLEVQERHCVRFHTYWFDPSNGSVFCLAEGPSKEALETVHREAHGQVASMIMEIDKSVPLNAFVGPLPDYAPHTPYTAPAMRAIVFTDVCDSVGQTQALGDDGHVELLHVHNDIVRTQLDTHAGREVKHTGDGIMASFTSVVASVNFAIAAQRALHERNQQAERPLDVSIGISAGEPVTDESDDLFGAAVQLAARLCNDAAAGDIAVSVAVRELCIGKPVRFDDRGLRALKGISDPVQSYAVRWRDERD